MALSITENNKHIFVFLLHSVFLSPFLSLCVIRFDLIANGGASLTLRFERAPFLSQERTVWLPWNIFYAMDTLMLKTEENTIPSCDLSGFVRPDPVVVASPLSSFFSSRPGERSIIPETQVLWNPCFLETIITVISRLMRFALMGSFSYTLTFNFAHFNVPNIYFFTLFLFLHHSLWSLN